MNIIFFKPAQNHGQDPKGKHETLLCPTDPTVFPKHKAFFVAGNHGQDPKNKAVFLSRNHGQNPRNKNKTLFSPVDPGNCFVFPPHKDALLYPTDTTTTPRNSMFFAAIPPGQTPRNKAVFLSRNHGQDPKGKISETLLCPTDPTFVPKHKNGVLYLCKPPGTRPTGKAHSFGLLA